MRELGGLALILVLCSCGGETEDTDLNLTEEQSFDKQFGETLCTATEVCNPTTPCDPETNLLISEGCDFDEDYAQECLDGEYLCNDEFGDGMEFIEVPPVCALVYDCP